MEVLGKAMTGKKERPVRVVQFGEGNFLRAFVDYMIDIANEQGKFDGDIVLVKPIEFGSLEHFHRQDCQYTVSLRGIAQGEAKVINRRITSVADAVDAYGEYHKYMKLAELESLRFVVSNTTEAGIVFDGEDRFEGKPPRTFPGKLTQFLHRRYETFRGSRDRGLIMLPVELIDDNGIMLRKCVMEFADLWNLGDGFKAWVEEACIFTSTLVDRIVTGYPGDRAEKEWEAFGYEDRLLVTGEPFALWVIESPRDISGEFPLPEAGLPVIFTENQKPYKQRKVRILNGAHTSFVPASYLCGNDIVRESMEDGDIRNFMERTIFDEVIPTLTLPKEELVEFAEEVINRFNNPYVNHALLAISLNSVSKWRARCLPSLLEYRERFGRLPARLTFSLAALLAFYHGTEIRGNALVGHREGEEYEIRDDGEVLEFFRENSERDSRALTEAFLGKEAFFGQDLNRTEGLTEAVAAYLEDIRKNGMRAALCRIS
ncbi:MAG: tagaturonate reductase [Lachnospiraceae bacterium]|nr:tagaturonate reductase [Lachnospiraceae bacterium]